MVASKPGVAMKSSPFGHSGFKWHVFRAKTKARVDVRILKRAFMVTVQIYAIIMAGQRKLNFAKTLAMSAVSRPVDIPLMTARSI
jgi:hypothetical protein